MRSVYKGSSASKVEIYNGSSVREVEYKGNFKGRWVSVVEIYKGSSLNNLPAPVPQLPCLWTCLCHRLNARMRLWLWWGLRWRSPTKGVVIKKGSSVSKVEIYKGCYMKGVRLITWKTYREGVAGVGGDAFPSVSVSSSPSRVVLMSKAYMYAVLSTLVAQL